MSFRKAIWASISMTSSLILPTAFTIMFLYVDLNTADLCIQWQRHNNTVPFSVMRIRAIGISVEVLLINLWFPLTAVILFGWKDFKLRFLPVLYIAFIFAEATVIYKLLLLAFGVLDTHTYYRYSSNILFFISIICCSIVMVCSIRMRVSVPYSNLHIMLLLSTQSLLCSIVSYTIRYGIVPYFVSFKEEKYKFLVAALVPAITIIPSVICKHIASMHCVETKFRGCTSRSQFRPSFFYPRCYHIRIPHNASRLSKHLAFYRTFAVFWCYEFFEKGNVSSTDVIVEIHYLTFKANCLLCQTQ